MVLSLISVHHHVAEVNGNTKEYQQQSAWSDPRVLLCWKCADEAQHPTQVSNYVIFIIYV
jgi:hypothetical protein